MIDFSRTKIDKINKNLLTSTNPYSILIAILRPTKLMNFLKTFSKKFINNI